MRWYFSGIPPRSPVRGGPLARGGVATLAALGLGVLGSPTSDRGGDSMVSTGDTVFRELPACRDEEADDLMLLSLR